MWLEDVTQLPIEPPVLRLAPGDRMTFGLSNRIPITRATNTQQSFGPLTLMPATNSVQWYRDTVLLTAKEFRVLDVLLQRRNLTVTRQRLETEIYD